MVNLIHVHLPAPISYPQSFTEPPALVQVVRREDVLWSRPIFKAPPLNVKPPVSPLASLPAVSRRASGSSAKTPR